MPQPRTPGRTTIQRSRNGTSGAPSADLSAQEAAVIRAAIGAREQAPSSRVQSIFENWQAVADQLGDPFEKERIPISKLRLMRRDPMLGFGLSFIQTPHVRARWHINAIGGQDPALNIQVAAHADENWRRVHASFVSQFQNSLSFGFQALAKRFEFRVPSGNFVVTDDSGTQTQQPIWSEGGIQPIAWKPFVALRPEGVEPIWDNGTGEFGGIQFSPAGQAYQTLISSLGATRTGGGAGGNNSEQTYKIDLPHSLWVTNEKEANFGSIFGYPRLGYAYSYWWSYWFRWAIADRAFERKADPSVLIYHPDGEFINEDTGERMSHAEYAVLMGERMRSGGVIALPSEVYEDATGKGTVRQWEISFTKDATNFDPFDKSFEYLDVQKLRSLFIPEQAFLEGKGGTSSRNVADTMGQSFVESQAVLSQSIAEHINRWIFPQWVAANYPEFAQAGGSIEIVIEGFGDEDENFMLQLMTLLGQQEAGAAEIAKYANIQKILEDRGIPIVSFEEQQRRNEEIIQQQQAQVGPTGVPATTGTPAAPGTTVTPNPAGTGFSYTAYSPREIIYLSDSGTSFIENLPATPHYEDVTVKGFARILWNIFRDLYRAEYESAITALATATVELADDEIELTSFETAKRLLSKWDGSAKWDEVFAKAMNHMRAIMKRATSIEMNRLRKQGASVSDDQIGGWLSNHLADVLAKAAETTRHEVNDYIVSQLEAGVVDRSDLAQKIREHFSDFPQWKADRIVRTEVRDLYNTATLMTGEASGYQNVQAIDAQTPGVVDQDCADRNGQIFPINDAYKQRDHPNGTLAWRIVPVNFSIERTSREDFAGADYDEERQVLTLSNDLSNESVRKILIALVDRL